MAVGNSINNSSNFFTSATGITATTGNITATSGDMVITNGYVVLGTAKGNSGDVLTSQGSSSVPIWAPASGSGISWSSISSDGNLAVNAGRYNTKASTLLTATLPTTAAAGSVIYLQGTAAGSGGWKLAQNASQSIQFGSVATTTGTGGYLASTNNNDGVQLLCVVADTTFQVIGAVGNITIV